jgi:Ser/Thr protein kinase RdoA (MazF antagonist)
MLKLRYLVSNTDLASHLLGSWAHDLPADAAFDGFRISSNAVYPFLRDGRPCYLRFAPRSEKPEGGLAAEIAFIRFLRGRGYPAAEVLDTVDGRAWIEQETPWGAYVACAFAGVPGRALEELALDEARVRAWGASLGALHALSRELQPGRDRRWSLRQVLAWTGRELELLGEEDAARAECRVLSEAMEALPRDAGSWGLVHYDFEPDNLFLDEHSGVLSVIDFDDAMEGCYALDVERALASVEGTPGPLTETRREEIFLQGYAASAGGVPPLWAWRPVFRRFADLYGYARVRRAVAEKAEDEPGWMARLRLKLDAVARRRACAFGTPLHVPARS